MNKNMKFGSVTIFFILSRELILKSFAFQVNSDSVFKDAVEKTVKHKVDVIQPTDGSKRIVPMITVFDDNSFSPQIKSDFSSLIRSILGSFTNRAETTSQNHACPPFVARRLSESIKTKEEILPSRRAKARKVFGLDENPTEYWFNNRIHTFGNVGLFGGLHAVVAPLITFMIDTLAYDKMDVRTMVSEELRNMVERNGARVLDLCCGVGMSTRALQSAFHDAETIVGIDTSPQMIGMARALNRHVSGWRNAMNAVPHEWQKMQSKRVSDVEKVCDAAYALGNAERTIFPRQSFDLVTIMYGFHEVPYLGRYLMLREARRLLQNGGTLAVIDICPEYQPSASMLAGEPYVLEYKENIQKQLESVRGFANFRYKEIIPGHVGMWLLTRKEKVAFVNAA